MNILILGGTGAMGTPLVDILSEIQTNEIYITSRSVRDSHNNIHYIQGDAHDLTFIKYVLNSHYDAIIDFMVYTLHEFSERIELFLEHTNQYFFLSSSRVYADNDMDRIKEHSPRLLDVTTDDEYIKTNEYALAKAREENVLFNSKYTNWTIIRPYITYNDERLQLGVFEKENWLNRALSKKKIVFPKDVADKYTTLTYGYDVSKIMTKLIGNEKAFGQAFHIVTEQMIKWKDVLKLYIDVIEEETGYRPEVFMTESSNEIGNVSCKKYQITYDRLYNRCFSNEKVKLTLGYDVEYTDVYEGLKKCLTSYIHKNKKCRFSNSGVAIEAYLDRLTHEKTSLNKFDSLKLKLKYLVLRYSPFKM